jgi:hypothetical protein
VTSTGSEGIAGIAGLGRAIKAPILALAVTTLQQGADSREGAAGVDKG